MSKHSSWVSLCELGELTEGHGKHVEIDGFELAVFLHGGKIFVIDNYCPHAGGALAEGDIRDDCVVCPWHGWPFKLESGQHRFMPAVTIKTYRTRLLERPGEPTLVQAQIP